MSSGGEVHGCGGCLGVLLFNLLLGGFTFDYSLWGIFGRNVPWYIDILAGIFLGQFTFCISIVLWILSWFTALPLVG